MSYLKKMDCNQFAELLLTMRDGDVIEFACYPPESPLDDATDVFDANGWYFAKLCTIPEYSSRYILLDYAGGGGAYAIPLYDQICDYPTEDGFVTYYVRKYFYCINIEIEEYVYVKVEDDIYEQQA